MIGKLLQLCQQSCSPQFLTVQHYLNNDDNNDCYCYWSCHHHHYYYLCFIWQATDQEFTASLLKIRKNLQRSRTKWYGESPGQQANSGSPAGKTAVKPVCVWVCVSLSRVLTQQYTTAWEIHRKWMGLFPTPTLSVGVGRMFETICLSVCPEHNSKTNDPKVLKLGIGNDLWIS